MIEEDKKFDNYYGDDNYDLVLIIIAANHSRKILKTELMKLCWLFLGLGNLSKILKFQNFSMDFGPNFYEGADIAVENNLRIMEDDGLIKTEISVNKNGYEYETIELDSNKKDEILETIEDEFNHRVNEKILTWNQLVDDFKVINNLLENAQKLIGFLYKLDFLRTSRSVIKDDPDYNMSNDEFRKIFIQVYKELTPIFPLIIFYDQHQIQYIVNILTEDCLNRNEIINLKTYWLVSISETIKNHYLNNEIFTTNTHISQIAGICAHKSHELEIKELEIYFTVLQGLWRYNAEKDIPLKLLRDVSINIIEFPKNATKFAQYTKEIQQKFLKVNLEITPIIEKNVLKRILKGYYAENV
ncbi:MAG: hypothetical protein ACTSPQ_14560 [Candidatus Helarchaeota archaeon]